MEIQIQPTEMSQGENGSDEEALHQRLTSSIVQKIDEGVQKSESFFSSAFIYRVPKYLRKHKESAYTPCLIAIGPLHQKDEHLQTPFQHIKMSYTNHLLSRLTIGMEDLESAKQTKFTVVQECLAEMKRLAQESAKQTKFTVVQECLAEMKRLVDDAKKCYAEEVTLDEEMMLVDGCFILEFLYGYRTSTGPQPDPIFVGCTVGKVARDLMLLENQIPFFVLEKLFPLTVGRIPNRPDKDWLLTDYVQWCYKKMMNPIQNSNNCCSAKSTWRSPSDCVLRVFGSSTAATKDEEGVQSGKNIDHHRSTAKSYYHHILHNVHCGFLPRDQPKGIDFDFRDMPSASELVYAGVKFVPGTGNNLFKFKFSEPKGIYLGCHMARFEIPTLVIDDDTESYLRNLIALEQCCPGVLRHVSSYAFVMDLLVDNEKDIQVLEKAGVLTNWLGATEDATDLFNKLCKEILLGFDFAETCMEATNYSNRFWPKNIAHVRRTYFKSPWTVIAFCVGFIVFIMTVLQFVHDFFKKSG